MFKTTMPTLKPLTIPERLSGFGMDVVASATGATGISRWHKNHLHSSNSRFVTNKQPQLVERPVVGSAAFLFGTRQLEQGLSNIRQVFKCQCRIQLSRLSDQQCADIVVDPLLEPSFPAREPSQEFSTTPSAFARDVGSYPTVPVASLLQLRAVPRLTCRGGGNVASAQINTNYFGSFPCWRGIQFNGDIDVETSISPLNQGGTGGRLSIKQRSLVVTNQQLKPITLIDQRNPNFLEVGMINERSSVQADAGWAKHPYLFGRLQVAQYPTNRLTDVIRLQTCCFPHRFINQVMQLGGVVALVQLSGY